MYYFTYYLTEYFYKDFALNLKNKEKNKKYEKFKSRWRSGRGSNPRPPPWQGGILTNWTTAAPKSNGGRYKTRTYDIHLVRVALYQLS